MPSRMLNNEVRRNRQVSLLSDFAARGYLMLSTICDDHGLFAADPDLLLAELFPLRARRLDPEAMMDACIEWERQGLCRFYTDGHEIYGFSVLFPAEQRQRYDPRFPAPDSETCRWISLADVAAESRREPLKAAESGQQPPVAAESRREPLKAVLGIGNRELGIGNGELGIAPLPMKMAARFTPARSAAAQKNDESATEQRLPLGTRFSPGFERFCANHPHPSEGKEQAWATWQRLGCEKIAEEISKAVAEQATWPERAEQGWRFFPRMPAYLEKQRWRDKRVEKGTIPALQARPRCTWCSVTDKEARNLHWTDDFMNEQALLDHLAQFGVEEKLRNHAVDLWHRARIPAAPPDSASGAATTP